MLARTDKERILQLEARVAELEEELDAYRGYERDQARDDDDFFYAARLHRIFKRERVHNPGGCSRVTAYLLAHAGAIRSKEQILAVAAKGEDCSEHHVNVSICHLRKLCCRLQFPGAIENVWGKGYLMSPALASSLTAWLEAYDA